MREWSIRCNVCDKRIASLSAYFGVVKALVHLYVRHWEAVCEVGRGERDVESLTRETVDWQDVVD